MILNIGGSGAYNQRAAHIVCFRLLTDFLLAFSHNGTTLHPENERYILKFSDIEIFQS
jgi:hypothetical protein